MICEMPIKGISISDTIVLSNSLSRLSSDFLKGGATGVLVGRLVRSANANWLVYRADYSETIQEPIPKPITPKRRSPPKGDVRRKSQSETRTSQS